MSLVLMFGGVLPVWGQQKNPLKPHFQVNREVYDFGSIVQGEKVRGIFVISNTGNAPLHIRSIDTSCGCMVATLAKKNLYPQESVDLEFQYDSRGKIGRVNKSIYVFHDDPRMEYTRLLITGHVGASGHPELTGTEHLLRGECRSCHVDQEFGKMGEELYEASCAMCHEHHIQGKSFIAPSAEEMDLHQSDYIRQVTREGIAGKSMPAYHEDFGGPLNDAEIESLVRFIRGEPDNPKSPTNP